MLLYIFISFIIIYVDQRCKCVVGVLLYNSCVSGQM